MVEPPIEYGVHHGINENKTTQNIDLLGRGRSLPAHCPDSQFGVSMVIKITPKFNQSFLV